MFLKTPAVVDFDPNNREHRQAVRDFRRRRAWGDTSLRFTYDPKFGSIANQVESKMLEWYLSREFKGKV